MGYAMRAAVFGLHPQTHEQALFIELNTEVGRAIQTHTAVEAALIASGRPGPWEYYLMLSGGDEKQAAAMQARAHLREMMSNAR